jgi:predicted kinase
MKKLTMMCGLPRSGKSTWVEENKLDGEVILSADKLRYLVYNQRFWTGGEPLMWAVHGIILKMLLEQGVDIIVDETNVTKAIRGKIIKLAKEYDYEVTGIEFNTPKEICKERAIKTGQEDLLDVIDRLAEIYENISLDEDFDYIDSYGI